VCHRREQRTQVWFDCVRPLSLLELGRTCRLLIKSHMRIGRLKIAKPEMIFDNREIFAKTSENASLVANVGGHLAFCSGTAT